MILHFSDLILFFDEYHGSREIFELGTLDERFGKDDYLVAWLEETRRWSVETNVALTSRSRHDVRTPKSSIGEIGDVYVLKWLHAARLYQGFVDGDGADVVELGLRHRSAMNLGHACMYQHTLMVHDVTTSVHLTTPPLSVEQSRCTYGAQTRKVKV